MKKSIFLAGLLCSFLMFFSACDKLPFGKKASSPQAAATVEQSVPKPAPQATAVTTAAKGTVIGTVNGYPVTLESLNDDIARYNSEIDANQDLKDNEKAQAKVDTKEKKVKYLKDIYAKRVLLYQEALANNLDKDIEVQRALEFAKQQLLATQLINSELKKIDIPNATIEKYYNDNKDAFRDFEERRIREIVVATETEAKAAFAKVLLGEEDFASLATRVSKAGSASKGGDLGFIKPGDKKDSKGESFTKFDEVAFSDTLEVGQTSNAFKGEDGYYILKLEAKKDGQLRSLTEVWDRVKNAFILAEYQNRMADLEKRLSDNAKIEIKEDLVQ